jgi:hypothetical protein
VPGQHPAEHGRGQSGPLGEVVGLPDLADLLPGGLHEGLLVASDHLGPEGGGDAVGHRRVQLGHPGRRVLQGVPRGGPFAVERGRQLGRVAAGDDPRQPVGQRGRLGRVRGGGGLGGPQRAVHGDGPRGRRQRRAGQVGVPGGRVDPAPAEVLGRVLRAVQPAGHRLDVVVHRGGELPEVVDGQAVPGDLGGRGLGPGRLDLGAGHRLAEAAGDAEVEGGHDAGQVAGLGLEAAGAEQAAQGAVRVGVQVRVRPGLLQDLGVRPGPRLAQVG